MTGGKKKNLFYGYNHCNEKCTVQIADGSLSKVAGIGSLGLQMTRFKLCTTRT